MLSKKRGRTSNITTSNMSAFRANEVVSKEVIITSESENELDERIDKRVKTLENKLEILDNINLVDIVNKVNILITQQINNYQLFIKEKEEAEVTLGSIISRIDSIEQRLCLISDSQKKINDNFDYRINALQISSQQNSSLNLVVPQSHQQLQSHLNSLRGSTNETTKMINDINKNINENKEILLRIENNYKNQSENILNNNAMLEKININISNILKKK